jgi:hypothetical protein
LSGHAERLYSLENKRFLVGERIKDIKGSGLTILDLFVFYPSTNFHFFSPVKKQTLLNLNVFNSQIGIAVAKDED